MGDVSKGEGRTVLFVSHNLDAVKKLCNKGILLQNGTLIHKGNIASTLDSYLTNYSNDESKSKMVFEINELKEAQILKVELKDDADAPVIDYVSNQDIFVHITILNKCKNENARLNFSILDKYENVIFITRRNLDFQDIKTWIVKVPKNTLIANSYIIGLALDIPKIKLLDFPENKLQLSIINIAQEEFKDGDSENGIFKIPVEWKM